MMYVYISAPAPASFTYILDENPNNSIAGFAFCKLRSAYAGNCIRIRRSSDNTEQDIGFSGNWLAESAISSFCGASNGFIVTWYDQVGTKNMTNATTSTQPQIYNGSAVLKENGTPAATFLTSNRLQNGTKWGANAAGQYYIVIADVNDALGVFGSNTGGGNQYTGAYDDGGSITTLNSSTGLPTTYFRNNDAVFSGTTRDNLHDYMNATTAQAIMCAYGANLGAVTTSWGIGYTAMAAKIQLVIYKDSQTDARADIIADINSVLSVF